MNRRANDKCVSDSQLLSFFNQSRSIDEKLWKLGSSILTPLTIGDELCVYEWKWKYLAFWIHTLTNTGHAKVLEFHPSWKKKKRKMLSYCDFTLKKESCSRTWHSGSGMFNVRFLMKATKLDWVVETFKVTKTRCMHPGGVCKKASIQGGTDFKVISKSRMFSASKSETHLPYYIKFNDLPSKKMERRALNSVIDLWTSISNRLSVIMLKIRERLRTEKSICLV